MWYNMSQQEKQIMNRKPTVIIRRPSEKEQRAAEIKTSDYQISGLNIQSSILVDMELSSKVYRSKTTLVKQNTKKQVSKYISIFDNMFGCYNDGEDLETFYEKLKDGTGDFSLNYGINLSEVFKGMRKWSVASDPNEMAARVAPFIRYKHSSGMDRKFNNPNYEPTQAEIDEVKSITEKIITLVKSNAGFDKSPLKMIKRLSFNTSFINIVNDSALFDNVRNEIYNFDGNNVGELKEFIMNFLNSQSHESERGHSQTVLNNEVLEKMATILETLKRDCIANALTPKTLYAYYEKYSPIVINRLKERYGLDLNAFSNFEDVCVFLYQPKLLATIRERNGVHVRARTKNGVRLGTELSIDKRVNNYHRKKYSEIIGDDTNPENWNAKIERAKINLKDKLDMYASAKVAKRNARRALRIVSMGGNQDKIDEATKVYENACLVTKQLSSDVAYAKKAVAKAQKECDIKKKAVEKLKEVAEREVKLLEKVENERGESDNDAIYLYRAQLEKTSRERDTIPYCTWFFSFTGCTKEMEKFIENELERCFNNPRDQYVNVYSTREDDENYQVVSSFFVDYPKASRIYKAFENKEKEFKIKMLKCIQAMIKESYGKFINLHDEGESNVPMERTMI